MNDLEVVAKELGLKEEKPKKKKDSEIKIGSSKDSEINKGGNLSW